ncbi:MAG TPA: OmpA family protein [Campylobacterales bacterium]|nr:OmpA family protein [Campylobacterales bacterium]
MRLFNIITILSIFFVGCSKTTIVLGDNGKAHNAIIVSTDKGSVRLDKVGSFVDLSSKDKAPSKIKKMSKEEMQKRFQDVIASVPTKPLSYMLYFKSNSLDLTEKSKKILNIALKSIQNRSPCMVDIIGHTDTMGSNEQNIKVSLKRAKYISSIIKKMNIKVEDLSTKGYGEEDLLVKTADNIAQEKNRAVEIFIK